MCTRDVHMTGSWTWPVARTYGRERSWRWTEETLHLLCSIDPCTSVHSTKVAREPILITEKWRQKKKNDHH